MRGLLMRGTSPIRCGWISACRVWMGWPRRSRSRRFDASVRALMVTDYDSEELRRATREAGTLGYAFKHNLPDLVSTIRSAMANAG